MYIFRSEAGLGLGGFGDRLVEIAFLRPDPIQDAGLVEMDVGFDKAGRHETAAEIDYLALGGEPRLDRGDLAAGDADIGQLVLGAHSARVSQNEIHHPLACYSSTHNSAPWPPRYAFTSAGILRDLTRGAGMRKGAGL